MCRWLICLLFPFCIVAKHKIQIVLTNPRTISTAFEKSIMARGDHKVLHEPWIISYLYHTEGSVAFTQQPSKELREVYGYEEVKALIYRWAEQKHVFVKDMVCGMGDEFLADDALLSDPQVELTMLIRDPARSIESFFLKSLEKFCAEGVISLAQDVFYYDILVSIAEKYHKLRGKYPIIVEGEELCRSPKKAMQAFCEQAGIPYIEDALTWKKEMPDEWKHFESWYQEVAHSTGFYIPESDEREERFTKIPEEYVDRLEEVYQKQLPFYQKLKAMKR